MRISDLDEETKRIIYLANRINDDPEYQRYRDLLQDAIKAWDEKHKGERERNLDSLLQGSLND